MKAIVYAYRGSLVENRHAISLAVVRPDGALLAYAGEPGRVGYLRSTAKPFQALVLFTTNAAERFNLSAEEIALATASHDGTPRHVAVAAGFLEKLGLGPAHLACGTHPPFSRAARQALKEAGQEPTPLHHNCSGKHAGMLAAALALGASPEGYEHPEHPVQQEIRRILTALTGLEEIPHATDGCSVPTFALPLTRAARLMAQLAAPEAAPPAYREGLERVFQAMRRHPDLVAGEGALDTVLMQALPGVVAKRGADGYYGLALRDTPHGPLGVALKVEDGQNAARAPVVARLLEALGVEGADGEALTAFRRPVLKNHRGLEVGRLEAELNLAWV